MGKQVQFLTVALIVGLSAPLAGQDRPLLPRLDDSRLWSSAWYQVPPPTVGVRLSPPPPRAAGRASVAAGYLFGGLIGLRLGEAARPPKELGLWLSGWYEGALVPGMPDRPGLHPGVGDPPLVHGMVEGFLDALTLTSGR